MTLPNDAFMNGMIERWMNHTGTVPTMEDLETLAEEAKRIEQDGGFATGMDAIVRRAQGVWNLHYRMARETPHTTAVLHLMDGHALGAILIGPAADDMGLFRLVGSAVYPAVVWPDIDQVVLIAGADTTTINEEGATDRTALVVLSRTQQELRVVEVFYQLHDERDTIDWEETEDHTYATTERRHGALPWLMQEAMASQTDEQFGNPDRNPARLLGALRATEHLGNVVIDWHHHE